MADEIMKIFRRGGRLLQIAAAAASVGAGMIYLKSRGKSSVVVDECQDVPDPNFSLIAVKIPSTIDPFLVKLPSSEGNPNVFSKPEEIPKPVDDENQTEDLNSKMPSYMDSWTNPEITKNTFLEITKPAKEIFENPEDPKKD